MKTFGKYLEMLKPEPLSKMIINRPKPSIENLDHFIGNPLFAIETNLDPLRKRIKENRIKEALEIVDEIQQSIEKAKQALASIKD